MVVGLAEAEDGSVETPRAEPHETATSPVMASVRSHHVVMVVLTLCRPVGYRVAVSPGPLAAG